MLIAGHGARCRWRRSSITNSRSPCPPRITADTGVDSFTHALEAWVSRRATPFSDMLAGPGRDETDRRQSEASPFTSLATRPPAGRDDARPPPRPEWPSATASVALVHGMSRPIGAHFHVPHGLSNAMLLPAVTRFSLRFRAAALCRGGAPHPVSRRHSDADQAGRRPSSLEGLDALNAELVRADPGEQFGIKAAALGREKTADGRAGAGLRQPGQQSPGAGWLRDRGALSRGLVGQCPEA